MVFCDLTCRLSLWQAEIKGTSMSVDQTTIQPVDTLFSMTAGALVGEQVLISCVAGPLVSNSASSRE